MNRAEKEFFHKGEIQGSSSTTRCTSCKALFPLESFECPQCDINFHSTKMKFKF